MPRSRCAALSCIFWLSGRTSKFTTCLRSELLIEEAAVLGTEAAPSAWLVNLSKISALRPYGLWRSVTIVRKVFLVPCF